MEDQQQGHQEVEDVVDREHLHQLQREALGFSYFIWIDSQCLSLRRDYILGVCFCQGMMTSVQCNEEKITICRFDFGI